MYAAVQACLPMLECIVSAVLQQLLREYGNECVTNGDEPLYQVRPPRICFIDSRDLLAHLVHGLLSELRLEMLTADAMTVPDLTCTRNDEAGNVRVLMWKSH